MKVLFVGHHVPHYTHTNVYREKAIRQLGHEVLFFDDRNFILPGRLRNRVHMLHDWDFRRLNSRLVRVAHAYKPDLCLVMGSRLPLPTARTVARIKGAECATVLWVTDAPGHEGFSLIEQCASTYDHVFCAGTEAIHILKGIGEQRVTWLPFGCDPDYHRPVELSEEESRTYTRDVVFVGALYPNRWETLKQLTEFNVGIWGPLLPNITLTQDERRYVKDIKLNYTEWVKIYSAAKVVVVIHYQDGTTPCYQMSPKLFEAMACKAFVLVDKQKDVFGLFDDAKHLVSYNSVEDLRDKIRYYLEHPSQRLRIAEDAYRYVLQNHTYAHRIEEIFSTMHLC
ncbi:MAG: glycosyltransferase [Thermodesulfobacteriota bacterium]|nr:glycosyltransferase [Thermodesulfobacteriota bacterium]